MNKLKPTLIVFFLVILAATLSAQRQTGSLNGKVADQDEVVLPGATVTISSAALMGTRTFVA